MCGLDGRAGAGMIVPQKRLVIVGATGMVGGEALRYALDHCAWELDAIGRKPTASSTQN